MMVMVMVMVMMRVGSGHSCISSVQAFWCAGSAPARLPEDLNPLIIADKGTAVTETEAK
jgi:hypothetical protein